MTYFTRLQQLSEITLNPTFASSQGSETKHNVVEPIKEVSVEREVVEPIKIDSNIKKSSKKLKDENISINQNNVVNKQIEKIPENQKNVSQNSITRVPNNIIAKEISKQNENYSNKIESQNKKQKYVVDYKEKNQDIGKIKNEREIKYMENNESKVKRNIKIVSNNTRKINDNFKMDQNELKTQYNKITIGNIRVNVVAPQKINREPQTTQRVEQREITNRHSNLTRHYIRIR
ncbi:MAG: hypothetical protein HRO68_10210 [Nitrosopumilus sp.]|nr:hypothetical protein [Nitrosopumilus sp.]